MAPPHSRREVDPHLDHLASGDAEIVPLEIGALDVRLLRQRVQRQTACYHQRQCRHDSSRFHFKSPFVFHDRRNDLNAESQKVVAFGDATGKSMGANASHLP
jgi:hypothetical protein